ncbi:MAG: hydroxyethylthiazole kinase [Syntrophales bacterium]|jgi:hydroxyethylthiazole kinase|nr:hydroxyethylthiazole kinase [Syntrophales bacterium]
MKITVESIYADVAKIRETSPLVHNITNYVVMNSTANALLVLGASPVMAHAEQEVEEMTGIARALVINIGTLSTSWVAAMFLAALRARDLGVPLVLDPVGVGATSYRTKTCRDLIETVPPAIIRGNASEIMALAGQDARTKGVDSADSSGAALEAAMRLNEKTGSAVCISGEVDYIVDGAGVIRVENGNPMMGKVTGLGCTATALCGAFAAVNSSFPVAAAGAMAIMGIAGEIAAERSEGPGSLQVSFLDALFNLSEDDLKSRIRIGKQS